MGTVFCLMLAMSAYASALEYQFTGMEDTAYYPATDYESVYGTQYNYGGTNIIDFDIPELPYGVSGTTAIGPMEKVRLPGHNLSSGFQGYWEPAAYSATGLYSSAGIDAPVYQPSSYTSTVGMEWDDGSIGTLQIPSLDISMSVWEGETNASMAKGLGHYSSTSGWDGNIGVCGHNRGARYVIGSIKNLKIGDTITYTTVYGVRNYAVSFVGTISSTDWSYLQPTADNRLTITTCLAGQPDYRVCVQAIEADW